MTFRVHLWLPLVYSLECTLQIKIMVSYPHLTLFYAAFSVFSLFINHSPPSRKLRQSAFLSQFPFQLLEWKHPVGTFLLSSRSVPIHVHTMGLLLLSFLLLMAPLCSPSPRCYAFQSPRSWPSVFPFSSSMSQGNLRVKAD